jgi:Kef-type K+ transport system membrane component KefB
MTTPVDAEQAWKDLQRIRVPQERVYDEMERSASGGRGATYTTAAIMWVFLAGMGLDLPTWGVWLVLAGYVTLLGSLAVVFHRRSRMQLHRSRHTWRSLAPFVAGAVVTAGTILLSGHLAESLGLPFGSLIQAPVSAVVFVLFTGPANRWAASSLRGGGADRARADR